MEALYYAVVLAGLVYVIHRHGISHLTLFTVLVFWSGLANYVSGGSTAWDIYKIIIFLYAVLLFSPSIFYKYNKYDLFINATFILFSLSFFITGVLNQDITITFFSQYAYGYTIPFLFYHGIKDINVNHPKKELMTQLLLTIVFLQVGFAVVKLVTIGLQEANVGSVEYGSGATAVVFPVLALLFYYVYKEEHFRKVDWVFVLFFLIVAIASMKRGPIFIYPVVVLLLLVYVRKGIRFYSILPYILIVFLVFYIGLRTNRTLNPEYSNWGSFDPVYAFEYALRYNFGVTELSEVHAESTRGRGGSLFLIFSPSRINLYHTSEIIFGTGITQVHVGEYGRFLGGEGYGIDHSGLMGVVIRKIYTLGYAGAAFHVLFVLSIMRLIRNKRLMAVFFGFYIWDLLLYNDLLFRDNSMALLTIFICLYSSLGSPEMDSCQMSENSNV